VDVGLVDLDGDKERGDQFAAPIIQMCFPGVEPRRCANAFTVSDPLLALSVASCLSGCFSRPLYVAISILRKLPRDVVAR